MARLLLADDDETYALTTAELFRSAGHDCDSVGSGRAVITEVVHDRYDVLVTDIAMPGSDDLAFLQALHQHAPAMPVIVVTGYPSMRTAVEAVRLSVVDYHVKPVDLDELLRSVEHAAARGEALRALRDAADGAADLRTTFERLAHKPCLCPRHLSQASSSTPPAR